MSNIFENKGAMPVTILVAASDCLNQAGANYVCDGVGDDVEIEAALNALPASGGVVQLSEGHFSISDDVDMVANATLAGAGMGATILTLTALTDHNVITASGINNIVIKDLTVDGNRLNNIDHGGATDADQNGIYFGNVQNGKVIRVQAKSAIYHGVFFWYSLNCELLESVLTDNKYRGVHAWTTDTYNGTPAKGHHIISRNYFADNLVSDCFVGWLEEGDKVVDNVFDSSVVANGCIQVEGQQNSVGYRGGDSLYQGNYIHYTGNAAMGAVYMVYPYYVSFVSNTIRCTQAKPAIYAALGPAAQPATCVDISHNIITSAGKGISAPAAAGDNYNTQCIVSYNDITATDIGIEWRGVTYYLKMDGNNVYSANFEGMTAGNAVYSSYCGNTIRVENDTHQALYINSTYQCTVDNNLIVIPNTGNTAAVTLIEFSYSTFRGNSVGGGDTTFLVLVGVTATGQPDISFNYLRGYAGIWLDNCTYATVRGNYFYTGADLQIDADCNTVLVESNYSYNDFAIINNCASVTFRDNQNYIDHGESRFASGVLVAGVANAIGFAWHNPEYQDILIKKVVIEVTTGGGTPGSHLDVGIADDAAGTNRGTEFFDDLLLNNVQINDSWVNGDGGMQIKWVFCQDQASVVDGWIVGQILDANAANLVGRYYIEYAGR